MARSPSTKSLTYQAVRPTRQTGSGTQLLRGFDNRGNAAARAGKCVVALLPFGRAVRRRELHGGDLVFGAVRRPVRIVRGHDIGLRVGMMERGVDHAGSHALGDQRAQGGLAGTARELDPIAIANAALLGVMRMNLKAILFVPDDIR